MSDTSDTISDDYASSTVTLSPTDPVLGVDTEPRNLRRALRRRISSLVETISHLQDTISELREQQTTHLKQISDLKNTQKEDGIWFMSGGHLENLEWAVGSMAICTTDTTMLIAPPTLNKPERSEQEEGCNDQEEAEELVNRVCKAVIQGLDALVVVAKMGKASFDVDDRNLTMAAYYEPKKTKNVLADTVDDMGKTLGYGPYGPEI